MGKYEPKKCWVGDEHKICYEDFDTAEMSARLVEFEHGLSPHFLHAYRCEYCNDWHLAGSKK